MVGSKSPGRSHREKATEMAAICRAGPFLSRTPVCFSFVFSWSTELCTNPAARVWPVLNHVFRVPPSARTAPPSLVAPVSCPWRPLMLQSGVEPLPDLRVPSPPPPQCPPALTVATIPAPGQRQPDHPAPDHLPRQSPPKGQRFFKMMKRASPTPCTPLLLIPGSKDIWVISRRSR